MTTEHSKPVESGEREKFISAFKDHAIAGGKFVGVLYNGSPDDIDRTRTGAWMQIASQLLFKAAALLAADDKVGGEVVSRLNDALLKIGDFAHDHSTGPAVPDALWEIRAMAYSAMEEDTRPQPQAERPADHTEHHLDMVELPAERVALTDEQVHAASICIKSKHVSISEVQRNLRIGYGAAQELCQSIIDAGLVDGLKLSPSLKSRTDESAHGITAKDQS